MGFLLERISFPFGWKSQRVSFKSLTVDQSVDPIRIFWQFPDFFTTPIFVLYLSVVLQVVGPFKEAAYKKKGGEQISGGFSGAEEEGGDEGKKCRDIGSRP